jgi:DNA-binding NtrC family response regulator
MMKDQAEKKGRLLIADDDEPFRTGLSLWLERMGYACTSAPNAETALQLLRALEFDAILADIHMPGNAGLEMIETIPQVARGLPVILMTGRPTVETAARSVRLSVAAYLVKPPVLEELPPLLDGVIANYRRIRALNDSRQNLVEWGAELEQISNALRQPSVLSQNEALAGYLRVTLRNVIMQLAELENSAATWGGGKSGSSLRELDMISALRHAVDVLEQTKQNFKSKPLADLRRRLEDMLEEKGGKGAASGPGKSPQKSS